ncbi:MAG: hypothetical protein ACYC7L_12890 [Nitrospirota bacterium]
MKKLVMLLSLVFLLDGSSALALTNSFDAGVQLSHITYKEPGLMRESGIMYGVTGAYTGVGRDILVKLDGTLSAGEVEYVGSYSDGTPLTAKGIQDTMFEFRAALGLTEFIRKDTSFIPYLGLGYRFLYDGADAIPGGYRRESNYIYLPLGIEGMVLTKGNWRMGFTLEYDLFLSGRQYSYLSDVNPGYNDMENTQDSGYGCRASLKFILGGKRDLIIEPFAKYWKIDQSDTTVITSFGTPIGSGYEPANNSTELGLRLLMRF